MNTSDPAVVAKMREAIRTSIFTTKPKSKLIKVFGTEIELRQPSIATIMAHNDSNSSPAHKAAEIMISYAYVPGTDTKVFEDVDVDGIIGLPWGNDMSAIQSAIAELTELEPMVKAAEGNS
jgi:hypothetical protein